MNFCIDGRHRGPTQIFSTDADDATCVDHIVRSVEHAGRVQARAVLSGGELIVGGTGNDGSLQFRDGVCIEDRAQ